MFADLPSVRRVVLRFAAATALLCAFAAPASAQVSAGLNELDGTIKFDSEGESEDSSLDVDVFYGRFLTDKWEVGPGWNMYKQGGETSGSFRGFASYHFGAADQMLVPYAQVQLGRYYGADDGNPVFVAAGPGVKVFFGGGRGALNLAALYRRTFDDDAREATNGVSFSIGASMFFK
jgi:hypothetical protein